MRRIVERSELLYVCCTLLVVLDDLWLSDCLFRRERGMLMMVERGELACLAWSGACIVCDDGRW